MRRVLVFLAVAGVAVAMGVPAVAGGYVRKLHVVDEDD